MDPLLVSPDRLRWRALLGTGGIGTGSFFALEGNHTLGREESRTGRFLDTRDYAKLHIIAHYVQTLMGAAFTTLPIGHVGADGAGRRLREEMAAAGMGLRHVRTLEDAPTMNCICLVYPDGSGGNLTAGNSACTRVDAAAVREAEGDFARFAGEGIALAAPEVPLEARAEVLRLGTEYGFLRVACFTSEEIRNGSAPALLKETDLLAINQDEAAALAGVSADASFSDRAEKAWKAAARIQPSIQLIVTAGASGSWVSEGRDLTHCPACRVEPVNAAGAGDALLAGLLAGLACGLAIEQAQLLGALAGALSVTSPHTIHPGIGRALLADLATTARISLSAETKLLLGIE